jgi:hypothetical protein
MLTVLIDEPAAVVAGMAHALPRRDAVHDMHGVTTVAMPRQAVGPAQALQRCARARQRGADADRRCQRGAAGPGDRITGCATRGIRRGTQGQRVFDRLQQVQARIARHTPVLRACTATATANVNVFGAPGSSLAAWRQPLFVQPGRRAAAP